MAVLVYPVGRSEVAPFSMPDRFRTDVAYFKCSELPGDVKLGPDEYWIDLKEAAVWLDDGVLELVSPLDSQNKTEVELSDEQEEWLEWMVSQEIQHIRVGRSLPEGS